ncbi:MAG TPA: tRNA epoxyqueuosine(34) reductase QueG [Bacillota bacterium]|nr:tRNA epoxyqueuosine(34) reductase QueG [Bacillota bacterium]HQE02640.1 tRNA epoxyqueuosine(34) reductase QueG [Bacillota bacterium]
MKDKAVRLGFCALGIATARDGKKLVQRLATRPRPPFVRWEPGYCCAPERWLPGAQSVLVGAVSYGHRYGKGVLSPRQGYFSPFAHRPDYHVLVREKLEALGQYLCALKPGTRCLVQVDSGPGCERIFALLAGIGWQGKNNFIIVPGHGSFVWLGMLVTDLPLPADEPLPDACGDCRRCLQACPTGAYSAPYQYAHQRCLAYWASRKGGLSAEEAKLLGKYRIIYGCDFCQLACPHNDAGNHEGAAGVDLADVLTMSPARFRELFGGTAAEWRGRSVLRRNAVLASAANTELRPALAQVAREQGPAAEWARRVLEHADADDV